MEVIGKTRITKTTVIYRFTKEEKIARLKVEIQQAFEEACQHSEVMSQMNTGMPYPPFELAIARRNNLEHRLAELERLK